MDAGFGSIGIDRNVEHPDSGVFELTVTKGAEVLAFQRNISVSSLWTGLPTTTAGKRTKEREKKREGKEE